MSFLNSKRERERNYSNDIQIKDYTKEIKEEEDGNYDSRMNEIIERDQGKISTYFNNYFIKKKSGDRKRDTTTGKFDTKINRMKYNEDSKNNENEEEMNPTRTKFLSNNRRISGNLNNLNYTKEHIKNPQSNLNLNRPINKLLNLNMTAIIKEITDEIEKENKIKNERETKRENKINNFNSTNSDIDNQSLSNFENEMIYIKEEEESKNEFSKNDKNNHFNKTENNNIYSKIPSFNNNINESRFNLSQPISLNYSETQFIKSKQSQLCYKSQSFLTLNYKKLKAKVKVDYFHPSIHKPNIINIQEFSNDIQKTKFDYFLKNLKLPELSQFLKDNIIACFTLYSDDLTMKDKQILENYYQIIYSFQLDDQFAILENSLYEDKLLIMIESNRFIFATCLPDFEFFIISVNKSLLQKNNQNQNFFNYKIERRVNNFVIEPKKKES